MSATRAKADRRSRKLIAVICLLALMTMGLSACRGFFGQAPIAQLVPNDAGDQEVPVTITFDISGSTDPDGTIAAYDLDFGDGSPHATGTDVADVIAHEYGVAGTYTATLTITDNDGRSDKENKVISSVGPAMITFAASRLGTQYDIFRMQADGTNPGAVRNTAFDELFPDLLRGTRDKIVYAAEDGASWNISTMTVTGGSVNPLTAEATSNQIQPSWSADGSMIAYASNAAQTPSAITWELYTMTALGLTESQLTTQSPSWAIAPACSPVNDDILFVSNKTADGGSAIWLWDDSISAAVELCDGPGRDGDASPALAGVLGAALSLPGSAGFSKPAWSPDGALIAYSRERSTGEIDIFVMDADGLDPRDHIGDPISLEDYIDSLGVSNTATTDYDEFCPYWLEDEGGICFVREDGSGDYQIHKVIFATGVVTELTGTGNNVSPTSKR